MTFVAKSFQFLQKLSLKSPIGFNLKNDIKNRYSTTSCSRSYLKIVHPPETNEEIKEISRQMPEDFKDIYPDFVPLANYSLRNPLREKLEREDMMNRRNVIEVPEFYVGSIMRVTISDTNASGKTNTFTGICVHRGNYTVSSHFTLRNIVDNIGVEIKYDIYCPLLLKIETLRLEKRLDSHLLYLRDSLPEYSTFTMDMDQEPIADGVPVPINETKVELKPRPWHIKWHLQELKGVQDRKHKLWEIIAYHRVQKPWVKYDLMVDYREGVTIEDMAKIYKELLPHLPKLESERRRVRRVQK